MSGTEARPPDAIFSHPRLAVIYDALDGKRTDLEVYAAIVDELGARLVLDIGCGTGTLACQLAAKGVEVVGLDPAAASIEVAQRKPHAEQVRWIVGDVEALPPLQVDLVVMTGNVAQVFLSDDEWQRVLRCVHSVLKPGGYLVFESRDPAQEAWKYWNRKTSYAVVDLKGVGSVEHWVEVTSVDLALVSFRWTYVFANDEQTLVSDSTIRFSGKEHNLDALTSAGFKIEDVRDAPDRPGQEHIYVAKKPS